MTKQADRSSLLQQAARSAEDYLARVDRQSLRIAKSDQWLRQQLEHPLTGDDPANVIETLARVADAGTMPNQGPRYFGFVTGSSLPVATASDWLVSAWDQNTAVHAMSPFTATLEHVLNGWILELAGLPRDWSVGYVTGGTMANFTALAAARHHVLEQAGWNVEHDGLAGAPPIRVLAGDAAHYSIAIALRFLGLGSRSITSVATDNQGRIRLDALHEAMAANDGPCIVCSQAGDVNTGAFDDFDTIADLCDECGAWLHVDGAVGLWAVASDRFWPLFHGIERADSVTTDAHKWLNVPYDCGITMCAHPQAHRSAMTRDAAYIDVAPGQRNGHDFVPEESHRARSVPVYAAMRTLGRDGLAELVEHCCRHARRLAEGLADAGYTILNEVTLNQVLVSFGDDDRTRRVTQAIQREGTCWCGGTVWKGRAAMRISVASWATTDADVEQSLAAMLRVAATD